MASLKKLDWSIALSFFPLALFVFSVPMLATSPQNPDGAELVLAAIRGGVLHPPGFPIQAWIDKLVARVVSPAHLPFALSLLSLALHTATVATVLMLLRHLKIKETACFFATACYAFFPPVWALSLQPEKYPLTLLLLALTTYFSLAWPKRMITISALYGLATAQHLILGGILIPVIALPFWDALKSRSSKEYKRLLGAGLLAGAIPVAFYSSMLLLTRPEAWPDWGKLSSVSDLFRHVFRRDYPSLALSISDVQGLRAITIFLGDYLRSFTALSLLAPAGLVILRRERKTRELVVIGGGAAMSLLFLAISELGAGDESIIRTYLERYGALAMFFFSPLMGIALGRILERIQTRSRRIVTVASFLFAALLFTVGFKHANARPDRTLDLYRIALAKQLPPDALYVGGTDLEYFTGVVQGGAYRFPIAGDFPWYRQKVATMHDPRTQAIGAGLGLVDLVANAYAQGLEVWSTSLYVFELAHLPAERRGLFWMTKKGLKGPASQVSVLEAAKLCDTLSATDDVPPFLGHYFSQFIWKSFREAFYWAAAWAALKNDEQTRSLAEKVILSLFPGTSSMDRTAACARFAEHVHSL